MAEKRQRESVEAAYDSQSISCRLFIEDQVTGTEYLAGSDSDLSFFLRGMLKSNSTLISYQLYAANGTISQTYE